MHKGLSEVLVMTLKWIQRNVAGSRFIVPCHGLVPVSVTHILHGFLTDTGVCYNCPSANEVTLKPMEKSISWIHIKWQSKHKKAQQNFMHMPWSLMYKNNQKHYHRCCAGSQPGGCVTLPPHISGLHKLQDIRVESNLNVSTLPDDIGGCTELSRIKLVPQSNLSELPKSVTQCKQLEVLETPMCLLKQLPDDIGALRRLRVLNLQQCPIAVVPESFGELQCLATLKLTGNEIPSWCPLIFATVYSSRVEMGDGGVEWYY